MAKTAFEQRSLRYDFTAKEIHELSLQLAKKNKEVQQLEDEKKTVTSQLQARINSAKADVNVLSNQVSDGWEYRDIECEVIYHKPTQGKKTIIRRDLNRTTSVETMLEHEWDLFNQPDVEENDDENIEDAEVVDTELNDDGPKMISNGEGEE